MNTPTISAVLPVASGNAGHTQNGSGAEPENSPPFSDVLTRQRSAEPSQATPASANSQNAATNAQAAKGHKVQTHDIGHAARREWAHPYGYYPGGAGPTKKNN